MLWRILGFASSIVAFTCFALSPSFYDLFGRWNLFTSAIYSVISLSVTTMMIFVKKCSRFRRSVLVKAHVGFLVLMLTSLCSIWQDLVGQKELHGRLLNMCSVGAFGLMSKSLSSQLELGFEVGISNFFIGSFLVLLMKMNFRLAPLAAILCYVITHIKSISDFLRGMRGHVDTSSIDTELEHIESGNQNAADHMHKNRLKEYAERNLIALPIYHEAENVESLHAPQFRSAVSVHGKRYTSENVFPNKRAAEQNVAKLAWNHIMTGIRDEGLSVIREGCSLSLAFFIPFI